MPWGGTPVGRLLLNDVINEAAQFRPQGPALPEEAIDRDSEGEADERPQQPGWND